MGRPVAAIFIHAGAGYHSTANEHIHLEACADAARASIKLMRRGGSAVDAVELAIRTLEDNEITNAGFGSNLTIEGTVECDATVVDHYGRSGACGAVPNIKNPISLAKWILQCSLNPLTLRRIPPNLLVGEGARDFAKDCHLPGLTPNEALVSKTSRDRFKRWQEDLNRAGETRGRPTTPPTQERLDQERMTAQEAHPSLRDHANAILTGTWNEGQPDSPMIGSRWQTPKSASPATQPSTSPRATVERNPLSFLGSALSMNKYSYGKTAPSTSQNARKSRYNPYPPPKPNGGDMNASNGTPPLRKRSSSSLNLHDRVGDDPDSDDEINDTVGAIAIDQDGYMAAGSSSGGIGMKHRGRVGPAALVGIGTAVIPAADDDPDGICVAAVTSGTGEHMATTMASQRCAERLYQERVRLSSGREVDESDEMAILTSFIKNEFLNHPGVANSCSTPAIGVMAVKKGPNGYYLSFAHNTDSFALASMSSNDREPACVMSRLNEAKGDRISAGGHKVAR
ncbi:nucleophile aminohydrolase [Xylariaceae sp. FL1272]|nr:nucleophile aminohydrolase [Xylariaceae sp. FL1272]